MKYVVQQNETLLEALEKLSPDSSKTTLRSWLKEGRIFVDGLVARVGSHPVEQGQAVTLGPRTHIIKGGVRIYYEDQHIVVIEKPAGLLSVATAFEKGDTAHHLLREHYRPRFVYPVHRLDQDTSGVMMFAFNERAVSKLKEHFEKHHIERAYLGVVENHIDPSQGTWESYLYEDDNYVVHVTDDPEKGRLAITHYEVMHAARKHSIVRFQLETGRKNQIRVHCQKAGCSIVGDFKYGSRINPIKRLCLHAYLLAFKHPVTEQPMRFESPMPETFYRFMK